jgi:hypothetical protein
MKWTYDIAAAISVALSCVICAAQSQAARTVHLSGYVQDVSGALVPGALVTVHGSKDCLRQFRSLCSGHPSGAH